MPDPQEHIGAILRAAREAKGLSQPELYRLVEDVSMGTIVSVEQGKRRPSARVIAAMATALDIDPQTLPDYRLAVLREQLAIDDRDEALKRLAEIEEALAKRRARRSDAVGAAEAAAQRRQGSRKANGSSRGSSQA